MQRGQRGFVRPSQASGRQDGEKIVIGSVTSHAKLLRDIEMRNPVIANRHKTINQVRARATRAPGERS